MMQIDTSIPMQTGPSIFSGLDEKVVGAIRLADMLDQRRIERKQQARDTMENETIRRIMPKYLDGEYNGDRKGLIGEVMRINPEKAQKIIAEFGKVDEYRKNQDDLMKMNEGREALKQYQTDMTNYDQLQNERMPEPPQDRVGPPTPREMGAMNTNALIDKAQKPEMKDYRLDYYSAYDPGIEKMMATTKSEDKSPFNRVGARKLFDNPDNREKTKKFIVDNKDKLGIDDDWANELSRQIDQGWVYDVNETLQRIAEKQMGIQPEVNKQWSLVAPKAAQAGATTGSEIDTKKKKQIENPVFSEPQSNAISDAYSAVQYLNKLKGAIQNNNLNYFDINRKTGQFVNPEAADAFIQMVEIVGRKRSGAAISDSEWSNFGKQILNKNNLLTEAGKKQAIKSLDHYLTKFYGAGANVAGDENWFKNYDARANNARANAEPPPAAPAAGTNASSYLEEIRKRRALKGGK